MHPEFAYMLFSVQCT